MATKPVPTGVVRDVDFSSALGERYLSYALSTGDGGKTWRAANGSLFGQTARFRMMPEGNGVGLVERWLNSR